MTTARAYIVTADKAPAFWQIRNLWHVMATGVQTGGSFCAIDQMVNTDGGGPPTHTHVQDEGMYIISGHCSYNAAGQPLPAGKGCFVSIPRHTEHSFVVDAPGTQFLNFYLPAGFEMLLMGVAVPAARNELPTPSDIVPLPPRAHVEELYRQYGSKPIIALPFADRPTPANMVTKPTPGATIQPFRSDSDTAPAFWFGNGLWIKLADGPQTDNSYCLFELLLPKGAGTGPRVLKNADEVFYVLDGQVSFLLGDRIETAAKGSLAFLPKSTVSAYRVESDTARLLNLYTPAGFERSVALLGERTETRTLPPEGWLPPQVSDERKRALFADLGIQPVAVPTPFAS